MGISTAQVAQVAVIYGYVGLWIALSGTVILFNKYILSNYGFPYPISLTMMHMGFCSTLAILLVKSGYVESCNMSMDTYVRAVMPIGFLYSGTLWLGNAAYMYLSVSFIQMLKALMPVAVFCVGTSFGTEQFNWPVFSNMLVVSVGVCIASYGEINFIWAGVILQLASIATESSRLTLVQLLLQSRGLKLNPITSLYYISPCCFAFLAVPFALYEAPRLMADDSYRFDSGVMFLNCLAAFGLNLAVFMLIGKTSALTMNIAGVVKDWMLIGLSVLLFGSPVTPINLIGYGISFLAVGWYNFSKLRKMHQAAEDAKQRQQSAKEVPQDGEEKTPLMTKA